MMNTTDKPLAAAPLKSYRYPGPYGWIMVAAMDDQGAMREVKRSTRAAVYLDRLQRWDEKSRTYK